MATLSPWRRFRRAVRQLLGRLGLLGPIYRAAERRISSGADEPWPDTVEGLPTPPPHLIAVVAGHASLASYLAQGADLARFIAATAQAHGSPVGAPGTVLDFGCGCGRVARRLAPQVIDAGGRFIGVDINRDLVRWSAASLPGEYRLNRLKPPVPIEAASVRLLYAVSVFTHLPRASMDAWLADYVRILAPGGLALVSFAADDRAPPALGDAARREGFAASTTALEGSNYMASYATKEAFAALCAGHLEVLEIIPSVCAGGTLDWAVLRRPA